MIELAGYESILFCSGLKCCHGSSLYEKAQSSILFRTPAIAIQDFGAANSHQGPLCPQDKDSPSISQDLRPGRPNPLLLMNSDGAQICFQPQHVDTGPHLDAYNVLPLHNL